MNDSFWTSKKFIVGVVVLLIFLGALFLSIMSLRAQRGVPLDVRTVSNTSDVPSAVEIPQDTIEEPAPIIHVPLPVEVRGIYWTAFTAATKRADELIVYMKKTGLNAVVIDLKMDNGQLAFLPNDKMLAPYMMKKPAIQDLEGLLKKLADDQIYRIARIAVMRDSAFGAVHPNAALQYAGGSIWRDKTGSAWADPTSPEVVTYSLALAREAYSRGFDEVQFDYVRFASDGKISSIVYPVYKSTELKVDAMKRFFMAVGEPLKKEKIPVSFDLFGLVCMANDGLGIGQRLQDVMPYTDFVSPMVYPSHYANGFQGFANPAVYPYEVIKISLDHALQILLPTKIETSTVKNEDGTETEIKTSVPPTAEQKLSTSKQFRPWIQDFDIGAVYTSDKIEAQIKATRDAGASGFLIWNARNVYEPANYLK